MPNQPDLGKTVAAIVKWLDDNHPEVWKEGLWDAIHEAQRVPVWVPDAESIKTRLEEIVYRATERDMPQTALLRCGAIAKEILALTDPVPERFTTEEWVAMQEVTP